MLASVFYAKNKLSYLEIKTLRTQPMINAVHAKNNVEVIARGIFGSMSYCSR